MGEYGRNNGATSICAPKRNVKKLEMHTSAPDYK